MRTIIYLQYRSLLAASWALRALGFVARFLRLGDRVVLFFFVDSRLPIVNAAFRCLDKLTVAQ